MASPANVMRFYITQYDVGPSLDNILMDIGNVVIDLTAAVSVKFRMAEFYTGSPVVVNNFPAVILDPPKGKVRYVWQPGDTNFPGLYLAWFLVDYGTGPEHFPEDNSLIVKVLPFE